jgi:hypothetical protein
MEAAQSLVDCAALVLASFVMVCIKRLCIFEPIFKLDGGYIYTEIFVIYGSASVLAENVQGDGT